MKVQFKDFKVKDIEGKVQEQETNKSIANIIFQNTKDVDLATIAMDINLGKAVELRENDITEIKRIVSGKLLPYAERQFIQWLDWLKD